MWDIGKRQLISSHFWEGSGGWLLGVLGQIVRVPVPPPPTAMFSLLSSLSSLASGSAAYAGPEMHLDHMK